MKNKKMSKILTKLDVKNVILKDGSIAVKGENKEGIPNFIYDELEEGIEKGLNKEEIEEQIEKDLGTDWELHEKDVSEMKKKMEKE